MQEEIKARRRDFGVCVECRKQGKYTYATTVKKVDDSKPSDVDNLICLCDKHVSEKTATKNTIDVLNDACDPTKETTKKNKK